MAISPLLRSNILCSASRNRRDLLHPIYENLSASFDPLTTPNLLSGFEAEKQVYTDSSRTTLCTANDDAVASWTDLKNAWHAENADDVMGSQPTFQTNQVGGLPAIKCDSAWSQFLTGTTNLGITGAAPFSMSFTFKLLGTTLYGGIVGIGENTGDSTECFLQQQGNTNHLFLNCNSAGNNTALNAASVNFTTGFHICSVVYNGTNLKYYIDGTLLQTKSLTFNLTDNALNLFNGIGGQYGDNLLQSAWFASAAWADADREALENYQSTKCGGIF